MRDDMLRTTYEWKLARSDPRRADCVTPEELAAVIEGTAPEPERLRTLRHIGSCRPCREELDLLRATHETAEMAAQPRTRGVPMFAAAAAAVLLVVAGSVALREAVFQPADVVRDAPPAGAMQLIGPGDGAVASLPLTLVWAPLPDARRYEVEVLTAGGSAVFTTSTQDSTVVVPATIALTRGGEYRWWVSAALRDGSQVRSLARTLRIAP